MKFKIAHSIPQRLLVRCGKYVFTKEEAFSLSDYLLKEEGIIKANANYLNGSVDITYKDSKNPKDILKILREIDINKLEKTTPSQAQLIESTKNEFYNTIMQMTAMRFLMRAILPKPLGLIYLLNKYRPTLTKGIKSLFRGKVNLEVLDATAIGISFLRRDIKTAGSIMFLLSISDKLEDYTRTRAKTELKESLKLHIKDVWVEKDGEEIFMPIEKLKLDDTVIVRTGSMIPIDGVIKAGEALINESSITGESIPVKKDLGKMVYAGTVVEEGDIKITVKALQSDTKLSGIIEQIDHGDSLKAMVQQKNENLADAFVPYNLALALGTYLITKNPVKAVSLLMVDYSCAIKLSTPITVISAIKEASEMGIIVKGGKFMERFANADAIVFDKTGTLTKACPEVKEVLSFSDHNEKEILKISACLEEHFPHSVARAIVKKAEEENLKHREEHSEVEYIVAHGIASKLHGKRALIGSYHFVCEDEKAKISNEAKELIKDRAKGLSVVYLALADEVIGAILLQDPLRDDAKETIKKLRESGFKNISMMTGDSKEAANRVFKDLQLDYYESEVLPEDKSKYVKKLQDEGKTVVMIGDGINDSPALALSDVSVSLKDSSDIAREVSDITLLGKDLYQLVEIKELSQKMLNRIDNNLKFIIGFNSSLMLLGLLGVLSPTVIALLHNSSTVMISRNSMKNLMNPA